MFLIEGTLVIKIFCFSSPAVLQSLLELFSGAVEREGTELMKRQSKVADSKVADTFKVLDNTSMSLTANNCSIPISSVAHVVVSPRQALLSEKERMDG